MRSSLPLLLALLISAPFSVARANGLTGVCPDGSFFIVATRAAIPCTDARLVDDASKLPPIRPNYLPRPYTWELDQRKRDPNNPYNLLEAIEKIEAEEQEAAGDSTAEEFHNGSLPDTSTAANEPEALRLGISQDDMRDLVRLVSLRQEQAPATFSVEDVRRNPEMVIRLAHSSSFESQVLDALGRADRHVVIFLARMEQEASFHPNFFFVHEGATYRPDPEDPHEVGWILGDVGPQTAGTLVMGYLILPTRFDPQAMLEIWWNDRSVETVLAP